MSIPGGITWAWDDFDGPAHDDEVMAAHEGRPTVAEQDVNNGAGIPAVDKGPDPRG